MSNGGGVLNRNAVLFTIAFVLAIAAISAAAFAYDVRPSDIAILGFIAFAIIILAFAAAVLWQIANGAIVLTGLISEPSAPDDDAYEGKASLSRFQFLIFTFVIAGLFLMLCIETGAFVEIPGNVLGLMGISGGTYVVSKAITGSQTAGNGGPGAARGEGHAKGR